MKKVKFKIWDKYNKKFIEYNNRKELTIKDIIKLNLDIEQESRYEFALFTGLRDEKRNEIYEGDILLDEDYTGIYYKEEAGAYYGVFVPDDETEVFYLANNGRLSGVIVGNKFETPELWEGFFD